MEPFDGEDPTKALGGGPRRGSLGVGHRLGGASPHLGLGRARATSRRVVAAQAPTLGASGGGEPTSEPAARLPCVFLSIRILLLQVSGTKRPEHDAERHAMATLQPRGSIQLSARLKREAFFSLRCALPLACCFPGLRQRCLLAAAPESNYCLMLFPISNWCKNRCKVWHCSFKHPSTTSTVQCEIRTD